MIHFINNEYDRGPIIKQKEILVDFKNDNAISLSKKVLRVEYELYLEIVKLYCNDKIYIENEKVVINE